MKKKSKEFWGRPRQWKKITAAIIVAAAVLAGAQILLSQYGPLQGALNKAFPVQLPFSGERLVPIYYVETEEKKVAFSFDACWGGSTILRTESRGTIMLPPPASLL